MFYMLIYQNVLYMSFYGQKISFPVMSLNKPIKGVQNLQFKAYIYYERLNCFLLIDNELGPNSTAIIYLDDYLSIIIKLGSPEVDRG